jgi:hypothetical protein
VFYSGDRSQWGLTEKWEFMSGPLKIIIDKINNRVLVLEGFVIPSKEKRT